MTVCVYTASTEILEVDQITRTRIAMNGSDLQFGPFLEALKTDSSFRLFFSNLLAESIFPAFRWETPALTLETVDQPFEFVLLNEHRFSKRKTDSKTFSEYFAIDRSDAGIVAFPSLGRDSTLIVPSPRTTGDAYGHLAAFVRYAPESQVDALWRVVGSTMLSQLDNRPRWLSTAGGGVAWLHVRIDSSPKYYGYEPYRRRN